MSCGSFENIQDEPLTLMSCESFENIQKEDSVPMSHEQTNIRDIILPPIKHLEVYLL